MNLFRKPDLSNVRVLRFLPSKRFTVYLSMVVCLFILYLILFSENGFFNRANTFFNKEDKNSMLAVKQTKTIEDSDNDGLDNWQEFLWRTDSQNPDTDSDGSTDGDEIKQGRNPVVAGPKDLLSETVIDEAIAYATSTDNNITDALLKNIVLKYMAEKRSSGGGELSQETQNKLVEFILSDINLESEPAKVFTAKNIRIINDNSKSSIEKYDQTAGEIVGWYSTLVSPLDDELILKNAALDEDEAALNSLAASVNTYQKLINELLKTEVPSSLQTNHLELINTYSSIKTNTLNMSEYFTDPLRALLAVQKQEDDIKRLRACLVTIDTTLANLENK